MSEAMKKASYQSIDDMHNSLNDMYKRGEEMANHIFNANEFISRTNSFELQEGKKLEDVRDKILLAIGVREFLHCIGNRLDFKDNNPLGSAEDEFSLGYANRANELIELEENGYRMKAGAINADNFEDRWEFKEKQNLFIEG